MKVNSCYGNPHMEELVFDYCHSKKMFFIISEIFALYYISNSVWKNRITKSIKSILKIEVEATRRRELKLLLSEAKQEGFTTKAVSAFAYPGGKHKMRDELNYALYQMTETMQLNHNSFNLYADLFFGAGGSFIAMANKLEEIGVKKVVVNEKNHTILNVHKFIRDNPTELIEEFSELVRNKIVFKYKRLFLTVEEYTEVCSDLVSELRDLENNNDRGIQTAIRFILIQNIQFSGCFAPSEVFKVSYNSGKVRDLNKIVEIILSFSNRINKISKIYNRFDIHFIGVDAWTLLQKYKNYPRAIVHMDLIYSIEDNTPVEYFTNEKIESIKSEDIPLVRTNYGVKSFNTVEYIKELEFINCIYTNNAHYVIEYYRRKFRLNKLDFERIESSSIVEEDSKRKITNEYIVYGCTTNHKNKI